MSGSRYDANYFDKWYRSPEHRVRSPAEFRRQVDFVLHLAEWVLERPIRTVLDVGCGEGQWGIALRRRRPRISYTGIDPSDFVVNRYGSRRGIIKGGITDVESVLESGLSYDLVLCVGMLNYLSTNELTDGLKQVSARTGGMAYLELFAAGDEYEGDTDWPAPRPAAWYRRVLQQSGFTSIGMQCYVGRGELDRLSLLERL